MHMFYEYLTVRQLSVHIPSKFCQFVSSVHFPLNDYMVGIMDEPNGTSLAERMSCLGLYSIPIVKVLCYSMKFKGNVSAFVETAFMVNAAYVGSIRNYSNSSTTQI